MVDPEIRPRRVGLQRSALAALLALVGASAGISLLADQAASRTTRIAPAPLSGRVVTVDAGHNGGNRDHPRAIAKLVNAGGGRKKACDTTGTQSTDGKLTEFAFTLDVSLRLRALLQARGARVVMTRTTSDGVGPCVDVRARIGNTARSDAAISIHGDGGPASGRGFHVIRPKGVRGQSAALVARSDALGRRVRFALGRKGYRRATYVGAQGLDRRDDLAGLNLSRVPKVLVELGNMRNAADARLMGSPTQRQRMASALADALTNQLTR